MSIEEIFQTVKVSITVSDKEGNLIFQNDDSQAVFGNKVGQSMMPCHQPRSQEIIRQLLEKGETHAYTIEKGEVHKMIYQAPWYKDGEVAGLVEFSMIIPAEMPHFVRPVKK